jgi:hypothetical protein
MAEVSGVELEAAATGDMTDVGGPEEIATAGGPAAKTKIHSDCECNRQKDKSARRA